jgi:hypothetical protein
VTGETAAPRGVAAPDPITPFFPDWVVPLHPRGTGRPVFVFPAALNEQSSLAIEARVAAHVGDDHPFWALARAETDFDRARAEGVAARAAARAAEYVAQMRTIQGKGPFLLYGNCFGGYLAWETARELLDAGEEVAGVLFYKVPIRTDFAAVLPGGPPVDSSSLWRFSQYYRPQALPIALTHLMTAGWHAQGRWAPWQQVALGGVETVIIPGETEIAFDNRDERIARHIRDWIEQAEARIQSSVSS